MKKKDKCKITGQVISNDKETIREAKLQLDRAIVRLINEEPFYGHILASLRKVIMPGLKLYKGERGTAAIMWDGHQAYLAVQPDFWIENQEFQTGLVKHEVLHIVFDHPTRSLGLESDELANIAGDLVCNQHIDHLPEWVVDIKRFEFKENLTMQEYYKLLLDKCSKQKVPGGYTIQMGRFGSGQKGQDGQGNEFDDMRPIDSHNWKDVRNNPQLRAQLRDAVRRAYNNTDKSKLPGTITGAIEQLINARPPEINWKQKLKRWMTATFDDELTYTKRRRSKRYGTFPGLKHEAEGCYAMVIFDTSGSITDAELSQFFGELKGIIKSTNSKVDLVQHDTEICGEPIWDYRNFSSKDLVKGRGGTDLRPAYKLLNERIQQGHEYSCVIHMTDGYGPFPNRPPKVPVLWVFSKQHAEMGKDFASWGASVEISI